MSFILLTIKQIKEIRNKYIIFISEKELKTFFH